MRVANLFNLAFSTGGLLIVLVVVCAWLIARPRSRAARAWLSIVVAGYTIISIYPIPHAIGHLWGRSFAPFSQADVPPGRTAVVLLGSGGFTAVDWSSGRIGSPDPAGLSRTLEAARIYRLIDPAWVVSSGGRLEPESFDYPLGAMMKDVLVRLGVPATRVIVKEQARDTHDEAQNVARLLPTLRVDHVVLVTSAVHMRRAVAVFRAAGVPVIPAPAREDKPGRVAWRVKYLPTERGLFEASIVGHEILGFAYYRLRGWR